jgi:hypothetical protein
MNSTSEQVERRKHKRYKVDAGALVLLGWYYEKVGRMIDISEGGLAFRYTPQGKEQDESDLTIVLSETNFYLDEVPIKTISDFELAEGISATTITPRRRGVQFTNPTGSQRAQIEFFINNYTDRRTEPPEVNPHEVLEELAKVRTDFRS